MEPPPPLDASREGLSILGCSALPYYNTKRARPAAASRALRACRVPRRAPAARGARRARIGQVGHAPRRRAHVRGVLARHCVTVTPLWLRQLILTRHNIISTGTRPSQSRSTALSPSSSRWRRAAASRFFPHRCPPDSDGAGLERGLRSFEPQTNNSRALAASSSSPMDVYVLKYINI